ncbi:MAG: hypothetical protein AAGN66_13500 [Acidobacteriota bacterium]
MKTIALLVLLLFVASPGGGDDAALHGSLGLTDARVSAFTSAELQGHLGALDLSDYRGSLLAEAQALVWGRWMGDPRPAGERAARLSGASSSPARHLEICVFLC